MINAMRDHGLGIAVGAAVLALVLGVLAVATDTAALGVAAGAAGVVAGAAGAALAGYAEHAQARFDEADSDRRRLRRETDALTALLEEEASRRHGTSSDDLPERTFDAATGLYAQSYFAVLAQQQVALARRSLRPVSIVIFEIDGMADADAADREHALTLVGDVVRRTLRESDAACSLGELMIGAILEDTPEAGAVWAAERVRGALLGSPVGDAITVSAGVSCYPTHALGAADLVSAAGRALDEARTRGADRVEIAPEV